MTSEILISLPEVFQTFAPQRGGGAGTDSSSAIFILISAEFLLPEDIFDFRFAETFPALACIVLKFWNNTKHSWYISIRFWFFYCSTKLRFVFCSIGILHAALENRLFTRHTGTCLICRLNCRFKPKLSSCLCASLHMFCYEYFHLQKSYPRL